jgi:uncharacterized delta-60 repeat protein
MARLRKAALATGIVVTLALALAPTALAGDGDLNTTFNGTGKLSGNFGGSSTADILGSAVQSDGKLVVVGALDGNGVIARVNPNGSLDTSFGGGDGITPVNSGADNGGERLTGVAIQPDGKIVAVGDASVTAASPFVLARVDSSGNLDGTFDGPGAPGDGFFRITNGTSDLGKAIAVSGTKVIFGGTADGHITVYQLNDTGTLDTAGFGSGTGKLTFDFTCPGNVCSNTSNLGGLAVQSDGKIVAVGAGNNSSVGIGVARITTAGALDTTGFHSPDGMVALAHPGSYIGGFGYAVTVSPGGEILVGGTLVGFSGVTFTFFEDAAIAAVTPGGSLDTAFGPVSSGYAILPDQGDEDSAVGIARQPNGKLLIGGVTGNGGSLDFMTARFTAGGILDTTFASPTGYRTTDASGDPNSNARAFAVSPTGVAYVTGGVGGSFPTTNFGIVAFTGFSAPPVPVLTGTDPTSPADNNNPSVQGTADSGTIVTIYDNSTCSGPALAAGSQTAFAGVGIPVTVGDDTTTTFYATATSGAGTSACSNTTATYIEDSPPPPPTVLATVPGSGANDNGPRVNGLAPGATDVSIYTDAACAGPVAGTGTQSAFETTGIQVSVPDNSTTTFYATAADTGGTSGCSSTSATYAEVTPAEVTPPPAQQPGNVQPGPTGQRAAALKKCAKIKSKTKKRKCKKRAATLPV